MKILILKNKIDYSLAWDIAKFKGWLEAAGLFPVFTFKDVSLPLKFKDFGVGGYWGLDGIKEQIRQANIVEFMKYDYVIFCYDDPKEISGLANWTYPNPLQSGEAFTEIVYRPDLVSYNGDVFIHECLHVFNRLLTWRGIYITDVLDTFKDKSGNEYVLSLYKPLFDKMLADYSLWQKLMIAGGFLNYLSQLLTKLFPQPIPEPIIQTKKETIEDLIRRIAKEEGVDENLAVKVAQCESGLNPKAFRKNNDKQKSTDRGLFQLNSYWYRHIKDEDAFNPEKATRVFCKAVKEGRLRDWNASKKCWSK